MQADLAKQHEKEEKERLEKEKRDKIEEKKCNLEQKKQEAQTLLDACESMDMANSCMVVLKLPSGKRIQQKFSAQAEIRHVHTRRKKRMWLSYFTIEIVYFDQKWI